MIVKPEQGCGGGAQKFHPWRQYLNQQHEGFESKAFLLPPRNALAILETQLPAWRLSTYWGTAALPSIALRGFYVVFD
jgi:hypothetical protein